MCDESIPEDIKEEENYNMHLKVTETEKATEQRKHFLTLFSKIFKFKTVTKMKGKQLTVLDYCTKSGHFTTTRHMFFPFEHFFPMQTVS